jgi:predicted ATP-grasp superfamily ATP-dependent carboligase
MRIFVYEFITGGGLLDKPLPFSLLQEGHMMLTSLLKDLIDSGYKDIICMQDDRVERPDLDIEFLPAGPNHEKKRVTCIADADAVWIIAPETAGILQGLVQEACHYDCLLLGSTAETIRLVSSKHETLDRLITYGIPCVPELHDINPWPQLGCVIKPDDGVGGEGCFWFREAGELQDYLAEQDRQPCILQPYTAGVPASLSLLCLEGNCRILSCNRQLFEFSEGRGQFRGVIVNELAQQRPELEDLSVKLVQAFKGLRGYVGVDLILTDNGPRVLEINPRLTTAYAGLRQSLGINPARLIINAFRSGRLPDTGALSCQAVPIRL